MKKITILLTCLVAGLLAASACGLGPLCGEELIVESQSPGGTYTAAAYERDCGATTDFARHVNLRLSSENPKTGAEGTIDRGEVFVARGQPQIEMKWQDATSLLIKCVGARRVFQSLGSWGDVKVSYQITDR